MIKKVCTFYILISCYTILSAENTTNIFHAIESHNYTYCERYLEDGGEVNLYDSARNTLLIHASKNADYRIAYLLLKNGADKSCRNDDKKSALDFAKEVGLIRMIKLLRNVRTYSEEQTGQEIAQDVLRLIAESKLDEALILAKYEAQIANKEWRENSMDYIRGLYHQGVVYEKMGRYDEAEYMLDKVIQHFHKYHTDTETYYFCLSGLAAIYIQQSRIDEAIELLDECVRNESKLQHSNIIQQVYGNRGVAYIYKGLYKEAESDFDHVQDAIASLPEQQRNIAYVNAVGNRLMIYYSIGTPEAIHQYEIEVPKLLKFMEDHNMYNLNYITYKQNWCIFLSTYGNIKEAYNTAKELRNEISVLFGDAHDNYVSVLNIIGGIATTLGFYNEALNTFSEALKLIQEHQISIRTQADVYHGIAHLEDVMGETDLAEMAHVQAMNKFLEACGYYSLDYLAAVAGYADHLVFSQSSPRQALPYVKQAFDISRKLSGALGYSTLNYQESQWTTFAAIPEFRDSAYYELKDYDKNVQHFLQNTIGVVPETQWEGMWRETFSPTYSVLIPGFLIDYAQDNPEARGDLYDNELFKKGLLLYGAERLNLIFSNHEDSSIVNDWNRIKDLKKVLNNSKFIPENTLIEVLAQKRVLENSIISKAHIEDNSLEIFSTSWRNIREALRENEVAIEFAVVPKNHWGQVRHELADSTMYYAYILRKDYAYPHIVPLFENSEIDRICEERHITDLCDYKQIGDTAYQLVWGKIQSHIHKDDTIIFAPTHILSYLPLENFPISIDSVVCDRYHISRVTSTSELLKMSDSLPYVVDATLFGGIQYSMSANQMQAETSRLYRPKSMALRSVINPSDRGSVSYLPETLKEVNMIAKEAISCGLVPVIHSGVNANEESFIMLSGKKNRLLHIATHGFYWNNQVARTQKLFDNRNVDIENKIDDPLSRCGLLFAGANIALSGHSKYLPPEIEDGILSAREISMMDLSRCNLVVLSSCESGWGELDDDGIAGLQRGFKMAGVNSIMMSLWPVDDAATYLLMTEFYKNYLGGKTKSESLREAQRYLRNYEQDGEKIFSDPKYWAAFVLLDALD